METRVSHRATRPNSTPSARDTERRDTLTRPRSLQTHLPRLGSRAQTPDPRLTPAIFHLDPTSAVFIPPSALDRLSESHHPTRTIPPNPRVSPAAPRKKQRDANTMRNPSNATGAHSNALTLNYPPAHPVYTQVTSCSTTP